MFESVFPPQTAVRVIQRIRCRDNTTEATVEGVVESWEELPTPSSFAHGKDGKLWLQRLKLRKPDGELTLLVIDDSTTITRIEADSADQAG